MVDGCSLMTSSFLGFSRSLICFGKSVECSLAISNPSLDCHGRYSMSVKFRFRMGEIAPRKEDGLI